MCMHKWEAVRQQDCLSKWSSPCQKSDAGGYYKWMQWSIFSSNGFSMFCLKPGVIDFHRFFLQNKASYHREVPSNKQIANLLAHRCRTFCWKWLCFDVLVKPKGHELGWFGAECRGIFFHTRLMSYCRCFDNNLVEYIELGNFSNFCHITGHPVFFNLRQSVKSLNTNIICDWVETRGHQLP